MISSTRKKGNSRPTEVFTANLTEALLPPLTSRVGARVDRSLKPGLFHVEGPRRRAVLLESGQKRGRRGRRPARAVGRSGADEVEEIVLEGGGDGGIDVGVGAVIEGVVEIVAVEGRGDIEEVVEHLAVERAGQRVAVALHTGLGHGLDRAVQIRRRIWRSGRVVEQGRI